MGTDASLTYDGFTSPELAVRLGAPAFRCLPTVSSTLDVIHELAAEGAPAGTIVVADEQVSGRGRYGRKWHSASSVGIWLGLLARPATRAGVGVLSPRVGLLTADALEALGLEVALKWPNDVVVRDRKLAGILCEARWLSDQVQWVAIGLGINVHGPLPSELGNSACAVEDFIAGITRVRVLEQLIPRLGTLSDAPALSDAECAAFARRDWLIGRELVEPIKGRARGIDSDGALVVETPRGIEAVSGGTVQLARGLWEDGGRVPRSST